jgi:hypothetical protein
MRHRFLLELMRWLGCLFRGFGWTTSRRAIQHSFDANILVDVKPTNTLAIAENFKILPLLYLGDALIF